MFIHRSAVGGLASRFGVAIAPAWAANVAPGDYTDPVGALRGGSRVKSTLQTQAYRVAALAQTEFAGLVPDGPSTAASALTGLISHFLSNDGEGGFARIVGGEGEVIDGVRDLDGHAALLKAVASVYALTRADEVLLIADLILDYLDQCMASPSGGYSCEPGRPERREIGHRELLDAILTLHAATGSQVYADRAAALFSAFREHFLDRDAFGVRAFVQDQDAESDLAGNAAAAAWIRSLTRLYATGGDLRALGAIDVLRAGLAETVRADDLLFELNGCAHLGGQIAWLKVHEIVTGVAPLALEREIMDAFLNPAPRGMWIEAIDGKRSSLGLSPDMRTLDALAECAADALGASIACIPRAAVKRRARAA